jgi:hypothetical protein
MSNNLHSPARRLRLLTIPLLLVCGQVLADPGHDLLQQGVRRYSYGEYAAAVRELTRASRATQDTKLLAQIYLYLGLSHAVGGSTEAARQAFVVALTHDPLLRPDPYRIKPDLVALFDKTRSEQRATVLVDADRFGATVLVDGRLAGSVPLRLALGIGPHRIEVSAEEGKESRELVLAPGATIQITARLRATTPRVGASARPQRVWTWVAAGGAVACAIVAGALWGSVQSDLNEYNNPVTPDARALSLEEPIRRKVVGTNVMIGVAGTFGAAAAVLFFVEGRRRATRVEPSVGSDSTGLWVGAGGRF